MTQPAPPLYRMIVVVDVAGFTAPDRHLPDRLAVRQGMYGVLKTAFAECDVDFDSCKTEDRGDGALILLPPDTSKTVVADRLPDRIAVALRRYNSSRIRQAQMRLRVSLNSGDVLFDGKGWVGEAIDTAFRILDARLAKEALAESDRIVAFISTQRFFEDVIEPDPGLLPELYTAIPVSVKTFTGTAYLRLHGELTTAKPISHPVQVTGPIPAEVSDALLEVIPGADLAGLRELLTSIDVPQLVVMTSRALGPGVPVPHLNGNTNAWAALRLLTDCNAGPDGIPPAVTFLRLLAEQVDEEAGIKITSWVGEQGRQLRLGPALDEQKKLLSPIPDSSLLYLTIMLEPVSADPTRCTLAFWRQDDPEVWPPALSDVREIGIDELELHVDDVIVDAERVWAGQRISAAVEFLLPRELINLPVHRWAKEHASGQPQPLRYDYLLGIRSLERMRSRHWHRAWRVRWASMLDDPSAERLHYAARTEFEEHPIDAVLSDARWVGLVLAKPPRPRPEPGEQPDELTSGLRGGLPLILWHPEANPEELREMLDWMLDESSLIKLLERRKIAISAMNLPFKNSLAHNLVVLWDDPDRP
ncbi:MAG TPA: hypothetical protein VJ914_04950, partial [Pseudonocardiaceae bacterium]|nr:hypothetical protein [Pseudonocardiaceae bacterium]